MQYLLLVVVRKREDKNIDSGSRPSACSRPKYAAMNACRARRAPWEEAIGENLLRVQSPLFEEDDLREIGLRKFDAG